MFDKELIAQSNVVYKALNEKYINKPYIYVYNKIISSTELQDVFKKIDKGFVFKENERVYYHRMVGYFTLCFLLERDCEEYTNDMFIKDIECFVSKSEVSEKEYKKIIELFKNTINQDVEKYTREYVFFLILCVVAYGVENKKFLSIISRADDIFAQIKKLYYLRIAQILKKKQKPQFYNKYLSVFVYDCIKSKMRNIKILG